MHRLRAQHYTPTEGVRSDWQSAAMDGPRANGRPFFCSERAAGVAPGYYRFAEKGAEKPLGPFLTAESARTCPTTKNPEKAAHEAPSAFQGHPGDGWLL